MKTYLKNSNIKATLTDNGKKITLTSYLTDVAEYNKETKEFKIFGYHSPTTGRHINEFRTQLNLPTMTKKQMFEKYNLKM